MWPDLGPRWWPVRSPHPSFRRVCRVCEPQAVTVLVPPFTAPPGESRNEVCEGVVPPRPRTAPVFGEILTHHPRHGVRAVINADAQDCAAGDNLGEEIGPSHQPSMTGCWCEISHGRTETRTIRVLPAPEGTGFEDASLAILIERYVTVMKNGQRVMRNREAVLYITSLAAEDATPQDLLAFIRGAWRIEHTHWSAT